MNFNDYVDILWGRRKLSQEDEIHWSQRGTKVLCDDLLHSRAFLWGHPKLSEEGPQTYHLKTWRKNQCPLLPAHTHLFWVSQRIRNHTVGQRSCSAFDSTLTLKFQSPPQLPPFILPRTQTSISIPLTFPLLLDPHHPRLQELPWLPYRRADFKMLLY